jgi:UDP-glucose 4-epimerase
MSLEEAVELVLFAFENAEAGDIMVQKSPASTIGDLASAIKNLIAPDQELKIIGPRHGEKLFETLLTQEERLRAVEYDRYFKIPADNRDLNYDKYFVVGQEDLEKVESYHSHNAKQLNIKEIEETLLKLKEFQTLIKV